MNLFNHYYYFKDALSHKLCDEIISYAKQKQEEIAVTGTFDKNRDLKANPLSKKELKELNKKRNSHVVWMEQERWIFNEIQPYIHKANKEANWNFDWDFSEPCQFTKYSKGQYYHWHCDSWESSYDRPNNLNYHGKIRKLSVTCSLSDSSEYQGGELEFNFNDPQQNKKNNIKKCKEISSKGSIVVFPSFVWHRVCPVKKGTRYSLVMWNLGYPYR